MTATVEFFVTPNPLQAGHLAVLDRRAATSALKAAVQGAPLQRIAYVPQELLSDETQLDGGFDVQNTIRNAEHHLTLYLDGQRRRFAACGCLWLMVGAALTLLWINITISVGTLTGSLQLVPGGPVFGAIIGLLPSIWSWRRARPHRKKAHHFGHLAKLLRSQRGKDEALLIQTHPALDTFVAGSQKHLRRLRLQLDRLSAEPLLAATVMADESREVVRISQRQGLAELTHPYNDIARLSKVLEGKLSELERRGGALDEYRSARAVKRTQRLIIQALAPHALISSPTEHRAALPVAIIIGCIALAAAHILAGVYVISPNQAIVIDTPLDRLEQLGQSLSLGFLSVQARQSSHVIKRPGFHLPWPFEASWPRPFGDRYTVSLTSKTLVLRAILRPIAPPRYEFVAVLLQYRVVDPAQWVLVSKQTEVEDRLTSGLSKALQEYVAIQLQAAEASLLEQTPQLGNDPRRLQLASYQLVRNNLSMLLGNFFAGEVDSATLADNLGVVLEAFDHRLVEATLTDG